MSVIEKKTSLHIISRVIESENLRHHRQKPQNSPVRNKPSQSDGPTDRQDVFASRNVTQAKDRAVSYDLAYKTNKTFLTLTKSPVSTETRPDTRHKMRLVCVLFTFESNTGQTDRRTDEQTDGRTDQRTDQWTDRRTEGHDLL